MITALEIYQSNTLPGCNLISLHNPVVFLVDATYSGEVPDTLTVDLKHGADVLDTFNCLPFKDISGNKRRFAFVADQIIRGEMGAFDDFQSVPKSLEIVPDITKQFTAHFYAGEISSDVDFVACHAARQYGDSQAMEGIVNNTEGTVYLGAAGMPIYVYFYNDNASNVITVGTGELQILRLVDYDDVALLDFDSQYLLSL